jgi:type II secretory pathway pseudopilin PulG
MIGVVVIGGMALSLYVGMTQGFAVIQLARENLRATQILQEKTEAARLLNWTDLNREGYVPLTFQAPFYAAGQRTDTSGLTYRGRVTITEAPFSASYEDDLRLVEVEVAWTSGNVERQRSMRTLVSKFGLQNYVYDPN